MAIHQLTPPLDHTLLTSINHKTKQSKNKQTWKPTELGYTPNRNMEKVSFTLVAGFVIRSATIWFVGQYSKHTLQSLTVDLTKWYLISICLHRCLLTGFLANAIVPWLSSKILGTSYRRMALVCMVFSRCSSS